ncbi:MAG: alpha/beta fold hydrolase [Thermomicrobiales bacterium]
MAIFVLVHGGWDGGWFWRPVARRLQSDGHDVFTATLTGSGERVHLASPDVDLNTHILDIVNILAFEGLQDVMLVGYSYSGMVVTSVAERVPERIRHLIYLDAFVPHDGQSLADILGSQVMSGFEERARMLGDGWRVPFGNPNADRRTDVMLAPMRQPVTVQRPDAARLPHTYILCTEKPDNPLFAPFKDAAREAQAAGWGYHELPTGHTPMETMPEELSALLSTLATTSA